jgi:Rhodopirellula transposase DDE domain
MKRASKEASVRARYRMIASKLDERCRRLWAAAEAKAAGYGGVSMVARATGLSRPLIHRGLTELESGVSPGPGRVRRKGAGPPRLETRQPGLKGALDALAEPTSRGDPESPLRWICKGVRRLAAALKKQGFRVGRQKVSELLGELGYSLQGNRKTQEGGTHPDRDAQFRHISRRTKALLKVGDPVISVDTKKKELVGKYKNGGREWHRQKKPTEVKVHDFVDKDLGRAIPYGVFDLAANAGWVGVGCDHDTAEFAVATIRSWWRHMGRKRYPDAKRLLITADGGGSNSSRSRTWKAALQELADELGMEISVCHFPPGTSKWNKIEHRLFSQIGINWRGRPLTSHEVIVKLIGSTTNSSGLKVRARLDQRKYAAGKKVAAEQWQKIRIRPDKFHGEWNYTIQPRMEPAKL